MKRARAYVKRTRAYVTNRVTSGIGGYQVLSEDWQEVPTPSVPYNADYTKDTMECWRHRRHVVATTDSYQPRDGAETAAASTMSFGKHNAKQ